MNKKIINIIVIIISILYLALVYLTKYNINIIHYYNQVICDTSPCNPILEFTLFGKIYYFILIILFIYFFINNIIIYKNKHDYKYLLILVYIIVFYLLNNLITKFLL